MIVSLKELLCTECHNRCNFPSKHFIQFIHSGNFGVHHAVRVAVEGDGGVFVPHELREGFDVHAAFQRASGEGMAQGVKI